MSARNDKKLLKELRTQASRWVKERLPERMGEVGVGEGEVRRQLETEADQWVQYNLNQRRQGREGTPSPDALLEKEGSLDPTLRYPKSN